MLTLHLGQFQGVRPFSFERKEVRLLVIRYMVYRQGWCAAYLYLSLALILQVSLAQSAHSETVTVGAFSQGSLDGWEEQSFSGHTDYRLVSTDGRQALRAISQSAASGLDRKVRIDLDRTPYLHWSWKVDNTLGNVDETTRQGDDYPARIYVVSSGGLFFWNTRAISYVWASRLPRGKDWPNAYTDHAHMLAVQSGEERLEQWIEERRDVRADFSRMFGRDVDHIDAIAVMTDTDNAGGRATAYYGDIYFSSD